MVILYLCYGINPNIYYIQFFYYLICIIVLVFATSLITSAIVIFFKDLGQIIIIFLQIGMWMTPIMWSHTILDNSTKFIAYMNPMFYITEGYRDTFINYIGFWTKPIQTLYFWVFTIILLIIGLSVFKKLRPHFADVL